MMSKPVGIIGTGKFVPEKVLTNFDLEKIVDTNDAWIREMTGIQERRIAPDDMHASEMASAAGKAAIEDAGLKPEDIDLIIVATLTGDMAIPSTSCMVQANLGCKNAAAFDLHAACSGFVSSVITAAGYINSGFCKNVLVIGVEILSRYIDWEDRGTCILFGDGAGAAVVSTVPEGYGILGVDMGADGEGGMNLSIPSSGSSCLPNDKRIEEKLTFIHMNGQEVYKFAVKTMGKTVLNALAKAEMDLEQLDFFIPHQANKRIIDSAAHRLRLSEDKVFVNLHKYGNTSGASVGLALDEALREEKIKRGDVVALAGFGAGLTWAGLVMKWY